jgi:Ca2+-binding RTX toxin-like protein
MPIVRDFTALLDFNSWNGDLASAGVAGRSAFLTYSLDDAAPAHFYGVGGWPTAFLDSLRPLSAIQKADIRSALAQWADNSGLVLLEVPSGQGDINFGQYDFSRDPTISPSTVAYALGPTTWFRPDGITQSTGGGSVFLPIATRVPMQVLLHEIGHAIGLKHTHEGAITLAPDLDNIATSVMSYNGVWSTALRPMDIAAAQYLYGGPGADGSHVASWSWYAPTSTLSQTGRDMAEVLLGVATRDIIEGRGGNDRIAGFTGDDSLGGGEGADQLYGNEGRDYLYGDGGADLLDGGAGADDMSGGMGTDTYIVDDARDAIHETEAGVIDTVRAKVSFTLADQVENLTLDTAANVSGTGNALANSIYGSVGDNVLRGLDGNDFLGGGQGADVLIGGAGHDFSYANDGNDRIVLDGDGSADLADGGNGIDVADYRSALLAVGVNLVTGRGSLDATGDTYTGIENVYGSLAGSDLITGSSLANLLMGNGGSDRLLGEAGSDRLLGGDGDDRLEGGEDADILSGGLGRDVMAGGGGADRFDFETLADSDPVGKFADIILGFDFADRINLAGIDASVASPFDDAFQWIGTAAFSAEGQVRARQLGTYAYVELNTSGVDGAEMTILLANTLATALEKNDFVL